MVDSGACGLCSRAFVPGEAPTRFHPFIANLLDPLIAFSDGAFHRACIDAHPLGAAAMSRYHERLKRTGRGRRFCTACGGAADGIEGVLELPHLTEDPEHALGPYNDALFHAACLAEFPDRLALARRLGELRDSPDWRGPGLDSAIAALQRAR